MKIRKASFSQGQLDALEKNGIAFDEERDYTEDEIADLDMRISDVMLALGFKDGEPTDVCAFWESVFDTFQDVTQD